MPIPGTEQERGHSGSHTVIVEMPNGDRVSFPSDMPKERIRSLIATKFPDAVRELELERTKRISVNAPEGRDGSGIMDKLDAGMRGVADTLTFGFADEIAAGLGTGFGFLGDYDKELERQRGIDRFDAENNTAARITGQVVGGLTGATGLAKSGATLVGRNLPAFSKSGAAALEGGAYGAAYGLGSGEGTEDRLTKAAIGGATGAALGGALEKVGSSIAKRAAARLAGPAPTADELASASHGLYREAERAGIKIKPGPFKRLALDLEHTAGRSNVNLRPRTAGIIEEVKALSGKPVTLAELDELRQTIGKAISRAEPQDAEKLIRLKDVVDNFADSVAARDFAGDPRGWTLIKEARDLWHRRSKVETLNEIVEKARNAQAGFETGIVNGLRSLANNKKRFRAFSPEEKKLILNVVRRGDPRLVLRAIGMLSPTSAFGGFALGGTLFGGGPVPAGFVAATGYGAKKAAHAMTRGRFNALADGVARGGPIPVGPNRLIPAAAPGSLITNALIEQQRKGSGGW